MLTLSRRRRLFLDHLLRWWWSDRYRNLLSSSGLVLGVGGLVVVLSLVVGEQRRFERELRLVGADTLTLRPVRGGLPPIGLDGFRAGLPEIRRATRVSLVRRPVMTPEGEPAGTAPVLGVDGEFFRMLGAAEVRGRTLSPSDVLLGRPVCLLGEELAESLREPGRIVIGGVVFSVIGTVLAGGSDLADEELPTTLLGSAVVVPSSAGVARPGPGGGREMILLQVEDEARIERVVARLDRHLERWVADEVDVATAGALLERSRTSRSHGVKTLAALSLVSLLLGGLGILNNMIALVLERLPEIGVRVAMGATRRDVTVQFLAESVLVTLSGALLGAGVGLAAVGALTLAQVGEVVVAPWILILPPVVGLVMGVACGALPAARAARLRPIETLTFR